MTNQQDIIEMRDRIAYDLAWNRLELGAIDEIDAAVFSGDTFSDPVNRNKFVEILSRWLKEMNTY